MTPLSEIIADVVAQLMAAADAMDVLERPTIAESLREHAELVGSFDPDARGCASRLGSELAFLQAFGRCLEDCV